MHPEIFGNPLSVKEIVIDEIPAANLKILEIEFWDVNAAKSYTIEQIEKAIGFDTLNEEHSIKIIKEVTEDLEYTNYNIAKRLQAS